MSRALSGDYDYGNEEDSDWEYFHVTESKPLYKREQNNVWLKSKRSLSKSQMLCDL